jgi:sucrose-6-phosphate hydrolase SacC (GH32 family)
VHLAWIESDRLNVCGPVSFRAFAVSERWRPGFHFAPRQNWLNDPNGPVLFRGEYHVYFQHNPYGDRWGSMSWGHATSPDLVRWTERPVAMPATEAEQVFSGSVQPDGDGLVAAYTSVDPAGRQTQAFARSADGQGWERLPHRLTDPDPDFRDPKLLRDGDGWLLLVALSTQRRIRFYRSADLVTWTPVGEFGPAGAVDGVWEMPDLLRFPGGDVLVVSVLGHRPAVQYFPGVFDGSAFTATGHGWADHGPDFYAATSFAGLDDRVVWLAWLNDWRYAEAVPTSPWRGILSVPRELDLDGAGRLTQRPVPELGRGPDGGGGDQIWLDFELAGPGGVDVRGVRIGWTGTHLELHRPPADFSPDFGGVTRAPLTAPEPVTVLVDRCSVEVFAGPVTLSGLVVPVPDEPRISPYGQVARVTTAAVTAT